MDEIRAVAIRVTGRVQGVGFRWATRSEATRLGLAGWVRNEADGSVSAHAEGSPDVLDALVAWCHDGPPSARVEGVEVTAADTAGARGFRTRGDH